MPNIKSAEKRVKVNQTKNMQNKAIKSRLSTYIKKFKTEVAAGNMDEAKKLYSEVTKLLDKAASDNVIHKNSADRKKSTFAKMLTKKEEK